MHVLFWRSCHLKFDFFSATHAVNILLEITMSTNMFIYAENATNSIKLLETSMEKCKGIYNIKYYIFKFLLQVIYYIHVSP